jgi:AraC-like DNA-binding protein
MADSGPEERERLAPAAALVEQLIRGNGVQRPLSLQEAAKRLMTSPRTLQRRLMAEGTSHRAIVGAVRRECALELLCENGGSVARVVEHLGFSEKRGFYRAFKRWTGLAPSHFRLALAQAAPAQPEAPKPA